jgi:predicted amidophosphoribosyltransferase
MGRQGPDVVASDDIFSCLHVGFACTGPWRAAMVALQVGEKLTFVADWGDAPVQVYERIRLEISRLRSDLESFVLAPSAACAGALADKVVSFRGERLLLKRIEVAESSTALLFGLMVDDTSLSDEPPALTGPRPDLDRAVFNVNSIDESKNVALQPRDALENGEPISVDNADRAPRNDGLSEERSLAFGGSAPKSQVRSAEVNPLHEFLDRTLVRRTQLRTRNSVSFATLRAWRKSIKHEQIEAMRALKLAPTESFVEMVAREIQSFVQTALGGRFFGAIVPMPCSHSTDEACLSARIAKRLAQRMDTHAMMALGLTRKPGSSHPMENLRRPPMCLLSVVKQPILLVDDIATSGRHIEEAVSLLRSNAGAVFAVAWLSGEVVPA